MVPFTKRPREVIVKPPCKEVNIFEISTKNIDEETVMSFGEEWTKFSDFSDGELQTPGGQYFNILNGTDLTQSCVLDVGCGTGRWTKYLSSRVKSIDAVDPSEAIFIASDLLREVPNVRLSKASVEELPFADESFDFVFSLGVLHHIPDTKEAMRSCISKLRKGGKYLVYIYYNLDNRGWAYRSLFHLSNLLRQMICKLPGGLKRMVCDLFAIVLYMPFILLSRLLVLLKLKKLLPFVPLSYYYDKSFRIIRNDSLDRFGTPLEQRFSKLEIEAMMTACGLKDIKFSDKEPYWHAIGTKA